MIIKTKRITSKNDVPGTDSKTQVEVKEKKAPGFREKITKTSTASITTSNNSKEIRNIRRSINNSFEAVKDAFKE